MTFNFLLYRTSIIYYFHSTHQQVELKQSYSDYNGQSILSWVMSQDIW